MFPARLELATFRVLGGRDNHYTTETTTHWRIPKAAAHVAVGIGINLGRPDS